MASDTKLLKPAGGKGKTKTLAIRVPTTLYDDLQALKAKAAKANQDVDVTAAIVDFLESAIKTANKKLEG